MLSFYQKLASKLNEAGLTTQQITPGAPPRGVSFKATGERNDAPQGAAQPAPAATPVEAAPEGTDPLDVDLFQSEGRMVIFAQMAGATKDDFEITIDEEANTLIIHATQKRPTLPPLPHKEGEPEEKGRYIKQETKWKNLYRKVYLPAPFDSGEAEAVLDHGVLVIALPTKKPGMGKKLAVKEILDEPREGQPAK